MPQFEISKTPPTSARKVISLPPQIPTDLTAVKVDTTAIKAKVLANLDAPISTVLEKIDLSIPPQMPTDLTAVKAKVLANLDAPISTIFDKIDALIAGANPYGLRFLEFVDNRLTLPFHGGEYFVIDCFETAHFFRFTSGVGITTNRVAGSVSFIEGYDYLQFDDSSTVIVLIWKVLPEGKSCYFYACL